VVVSSLWLVDDQATAELMEHMHRELRKGRPADVALAHAMRAVRKIPGWSDPYFWSGFRVVGGGWRE
jgi:CHAT domain-containing protein